MIPLDTLTASAFAAEVSAFDAAHPGTPHAEMPRYREVTLLIQARIPGAGSREIAAALDDTLVDGTTQPDARLIDLLRHHRIAADRWRD